MNTYKIVLLGDSGVGKTSLIKRYLYDKFDIMENITLGGLFFNKIIDYKDKQKIKLDIWDTAGQERFKSMLPMYIRNTDIAIIVFDSCKINNVKEYFETWITFIRENNNNNILIYLIGNKRDLIKIQNIDTDILYKLDLDRRNICFVSAKTGEFVQELFDKIINDIIENDMIVDKIVDKIEGKIEISNNKKNKYNCCYK
jgi:small GTP-binding protein